MKSKTRELEKFLVSKNASIKEAMKAIDMRGFGIIFVVGKSNTIFGVVTDGDVRRAILNGIDIKKSIESIANKKPIVIVGRATQKEILNLKNRKEMPPAGFLKVPIIDEKGRIKDILFISASEKKFQYFNKKSKSKKEGVKKVLITGGAGYLGSVLCRKLLHDGYHVKVLDNMTYGDEGIKELYKNPRFEFLRGDVRNISEIMNAVKGMDAVIHLSAIVGDSASQIDSRETIEINYLSVKAVAEACKFNQINKFLFASTCSVYGANKIPEEKLDENSPVTPISLYAETKLKSEEGILSLVDENFSPTIFRFATLFGVSPRMRFDLVVNIMTANASGEKKVTVLGGNQWRPNLEVSDAAEACAKWVASPIEKTGGHIFNVGGNAHNARIIDIARIVKKVIPGTTIQRDIGSVDQRNYNVSFDKVSIVLGFKPKKTIEMGVREIKKLIEIDAIKDFNDHKYSNYGFLVNNRIVTHGGSAAPIKHLKS